MPAAIKTSFDAAFWLVDTALHNSEYLQPQKMHRLLFLAQAYYSVAYNGNKLIPAMFVAEEMGPIEPNLYAAFSKGRPDMDIDMFLNVEAEAFLSDIWRRFGHQTADILTRISKESPAYQRAYSKGKGAEITLESMRMSFGRGENTPEVEQVVRPKVLVTQSGRPVKIKSWIP